MRINDFARTAIFFAMRKIRIITGIGWIFAWKICLICIIFGACIMLE